MTYHFLLDSRHEFLQQRNINNIRTPQHTQLSTFNANYMEMKKTVLIYKNNRLATNETAIKQQHKQYANEIELSFVCSVVIGAISFYRKSKYRN